MLLTHRICTPFYVTEACCTFTVPTLRIAHMSLMHVKRARDVHVMSYAWPKLMSVLHVAKRAPCVRHMILISHACQMPMSIMHMQRPRAVHVISRPCELNDAYVKLWALCWRGSGCGAVACCCHDNPCISRQALHTVIIACCVYHGKSCMSSLSLNVQLLRHGSFLWCNLIGGSFIHQQVRIRLFMQCINNKHVLLYLPLMSDGW